MILKSDAMMVTGCQQYCSRVVRNVLKGPIYRITAGGGGGAHSQLFRLIPRPHCHHHRLMRFIPAASQEIYPTA